MKLKILSLLTTLFLATAPALADPVTFDLTTIDTFTQVHADPDSAFHKVESTAFGNPFTRFTNDFEPITGPGEAWVGLTGLNLDWSSYDSFQLWIMNENESSWDFQIIVKDSDATQSFTPLVSLVPGQSTVLSANLNNGLDKSDIDMVLVRLTGDLPRNDNGDITAEYLVSSVPEPGMLVLLGMSLMSLPFLSRQRAGSNRQ